MAYLCDQNRLRFMLRNNKVTGHKKWTFNKKHSRFKHCNINRDTVRFGKVMPVFRVLVTPSPAENQTQYTPKAY